jgi:hypothetical protein
VIRRLLLGALDGLQWRLDWLRDWVVCVDLGRERHVACLDCGVDTVALGEYYALHEDVWLRAHPAGEGMLCIGCVERRLGRRLNALDFTAAPVNFDRSESRVRERVARGRDR